LETGVSYTPAVVNADRTVTVEGVTLALRVTRKRVKNINVRLVAGELRVSAPPWVSQRELDEAIAALARRLVRRERARQVNGSHDALELARKVARRFPNPPRIAEARFSTQQMARWGSYSTRTRTIRLSAALRQMPSWVLEAVVAHELAHVSHPDHSPAFWALLRKVCPHTDRARAFLEGVGWVAARWAELPPVERAQLAGIDGES
jgi:predicted metal-dependent hydrolase